MINKIHSACTKVETAFNVAGAIPIVSIYSGSLRFTAGEIQCVAGAIFALITAIGTIIVNFRHPNSSEAKNWKKGIEHGVTHAMHGGLNILRGQAEMMLGLTIIGSLGLLLYQGATSFEPQISYDDLSVSLPQKV